jgi:hypothetical protein
METKLRLHHRQEKLFGRLEQHLATALQNGPVAEAYGVCPTQSGSFRFQPPPNAR